MKMRSVMEHAFSMVPSAEIPRSSFDRSHGYKTTFDAGLLIPIFIDEALPGDTFNLSMTGFARMATPIFPIMDNIFMDTFFFAVPHRLIWENWERFCGAQDDPDDSTDFVVPRIAFGETGAPAGSLFDYFGIPPGIFNSSVNAFASRAYNLIWNEWFRDQNLQDSVTVDLDDGPDAIADYVLLRRGKRHDYFTSCLPWPQKGDAVVLPLGDSAPVSGGVITGEAPFTPTFNHGTTVGSTLGVGAADNVVNVSGATSAGVLSWNDPNLQFTGAIADLSLATAATINQLRQAFQVQRLLERDARGGTRYTEIVRSHFGVLSPDARLQRPEYLGGGSTPINVSAVANTTGTIGATPDDSNARPQGSLAAFASVSLHGHGFVKSFTEHCVVIGLVSVRADLTYQQGLNRMWDRQTRYDFFWPALAHIGEQAVLNREIFYSGVVLTDESVFGYQERFAEYRYKPSVITGLFRSDAAGSLDAWHVAIDFADTPLLNDAFIQENPPIDRVIAVPTEPHFLFDSYFNFRCARPMPMFGVPGMIDHF